MKILIGINTLTEVEQSVYSNHLQFWYRLGRKYGDKIDFILNSPRRQSIDRMRNVSAQVAIDNNCDYLMFIDDDVLIPINALDKLLAADKDIVAGWTIIRGYPFKNMFFRFTDDTEKHLDNVKDEDLDPLENPLIKVDAVGFSCVLIKVDFLKKIQPPYFVTGPFNTEDIYFCMKAKETLGKDFECYVDLSVVTQHNLGSEYIGPQNKAAFKRYAEEVQGLSEKPEEQFKPYDHNLLREAQIEGKPSYEDVLVAELKL